MLPRKSHALPESLQLGGGHVPVRISHHARAKAMRLYYDGKRRQIRLTLPKRASKRQAAAFLQEKTAWLEGQIAKQPEPVAFVDGVVLPVLGASLTLHHTDARRGHITQTGDNIHATCPAEHLEARLTRWLKARLREVVLEEAQKHSDTLGVRFNRISIRDTSSRWGSCSRSGNLSFSWRMVFAPREVLSYLIAHEVAHLREMHHGPAFWEVVAQLHPNYEHDRNWLREHGNALYRYGPAR